MRVFAFYLPQFHPIPENDSWWGPGFTEWTNVVRARPHFRGHEQPRLPRDLGYYDLRLPETMEQQAGLAAAHGISAFTVWHYWFAGKRLLERPVDQVLSNPGINFEFNLAWANEPWSRRWLGDDADVLQAQRYSHDDDVAHARWLIQAFIDDRYTKVGERPLFSIYNPSALPEPARTVETLRRVAADAGLDPYLAAINARYRTADYLSFGFDAIIDFEPQLGSLPHALGDGFSKRRLLSNLSRGVASGRLKIYDDEDARRFMSLDRPPNVTHRSVYVGFDNTPRRGRDGIVIKNWSPSSFAAAVADAQAAASERPHDEQAFWINAWNEWAEGNFLEPDSSSRRLKLETLAEVLLRGRPMS